MQQNMRRLGLALLALTFVVFAQPQTIAQEEGGGFKNLRIFPKDIPKDQLKATMKSFTEQLGVKCTHCHVKDEYDKDEKEPKTVARGMLKMVGNLRANADEFFPEGRIEHLRCWTCHRGQAEPEEWVPEEEEEED